MTPDPTNGGRRINNLEKKDAVHDTQIDLLVQQSKATHDMVAELVPCVSSMKTHIKIQWWFIGGIVVGLAGITFAIIKTAAGA